MADTKHGHGEPPEFDSELDVPAIVKGFVWTLVITALSFVAMWFVYSGFKSRLEAQDPPRSPLPEAQQRQIPAEPRLQAAAESDLAAVRVQEAEVLGSYGLIAGQPGMARIPIDRAMALYVQKHGGAPAPAPAPVEPTPAAEPAHGGSGH
jgi:hypothetical protein